MIFVLYLVLQYHTCIMCIVHECCFLQCAFIRTDSRFAPTPPSQWVTALPCKDVSHWLGASLKSALFLLSVYDDMGMLNYWLFVRRNHEALVYFPHNGPARQTFDVYFVVSLNKLLNKQLSCQWFEMPWLLWYHCNIMFSYLSYERAPLCFQTVAGSKLSAEAEEFTPAKFRVGGDVGGLDVPSGGSAMVNGGSLASQPLNNLPRYMTNCYPFVTDQGTRHARWVHDAASLLFKDGHPVPKCWYQMLNVNRNHPVICHGWSVGWPRVSIH